MSGAQMPVVAGGDAADGDGAEVSAGGRVCSAAAQYRGDVRTSARRPVLRRSDAVDVVDEVASEETVSACPYKQVIVHCRGSAGAQEVHSVLEPVTETVDDVGPSGTLRSSVDSGTDAGCTEAPSASKLSIGNVPTPSSDTAPPGGASRPHQSSSPPQLPVIPRRFKRPPLLRARTTQLNLLPSPEMTIRKHYGRSKSMPASASDDQLIPAFLNLRALPDETVQNIGTHYYPEGGWGWWVLGVATLLHGSLAGLGLAWGVLLPEVLQEFFDKEERTGITAVCTTGQWLEPIGQVFILLT